MIEEMFNSSGSQAFEEFEYRLIYLRPTEYSEERIAVGVISEGQGRLESRFLSSPASIDLMTKIFSEDGVEQFHFAAGELRRMISGLPGLDSVRMPSDLLIAGEKIVAYTSDRDGLLSSILASSSCLARTGTLRGSDIVNGPQRSALSLQLCEHINRLNPLVARNMFHRKVTVESGETVDVPILGLRIFGAPVSFASKDQKMRAESYVAKFHWLRRYVPQQPRMYLLTPSDENGDAYNRHDSSIRELRAIAEASNVLVRTSESTEELAVLILQDEAA
jgi:hypothetical protein